MENVVTTCRLVTKFSPAAAGVFEAQTQLITVCSKQIVPTSHTVVSCFFLNSACHIINMKGQCHSVS